MTPEVNVLALVKGRERFVYVYDDASHPDLIATLRTRFAPHWVPTPVDAVEDPDLKELQLEEMEEAEGD